MQDRCPSCSARCIVSFECTQAPALLWLHYFDSNKRKLSELNKTISLRRVADGKQRAVSYQLAGVIYKPGAHFTADVCYGSDFSVWHHYDDFKYQNGKAAYIGSGPNLQRLPIMTHLLYERMP